MSKEVGAGGRFDIFLDSGVTIKTLVVVQHEHCQEEKAMENYSFSLRISNNP